MGRLLQGLAYVLAITFTGMATVLFAKLVTGSAPGTIGKFLICLGFAIGSIGLADLSTGRVHGAPVVAMGWAGFIVGLLALVVPVMELLSNWNLTDIGLGCASVGLGLISVARAMWLSEGIR